MYRKIYISASCRPRTLRFLARCMRRCGALLLCGGYVCDKLAQLRPV